MSAIVSYCRSLDDEAAAPDLSKRSGDEAFCNAEVMCKCGNGPVVCCRGPHEGSPHAAFGKRNLLTVWTDEVRTASNSDARKRHTPAPDPVEVVARELVASGASPGDGLHSWRCEYPDLYPPCDCVNEAATDIIAALRAEGMIND